MLNLSKQEKRNSIIEICCFGTSMLFFIILIFLLFNLRVNFSGSIPIGVYAKCISPEIRCGDYVCFCLTDGYYSNMQKERGYAPGTNLLLKIVRGVPGDYFDIDESGLYLNGYLIPKSNIALKDSQGRPIPVSTNLAPGHIPQGKALVMSLDHPGGFDSRYFGFVSIDALEKVTPIVTFKGGENGNG